MNSLTGEEEDGERNFVTSCLFSPGTKGLSARPLTFLAFVVGQLEKGRLSP